MANGHGGYRAPANPAPVSGPGAHSQRTDGGPAQVLSAVPDQGYGEAGQQLNDQRIAPMAGQQPMPPVPNVPTSPPAGQSPQGQYTGGPFNAPTARPNEPVTAGSPLGPGPGPSVLPMDSQPNTPAAGTMTQLLSGLMATDTTGVLSALLQQAQARGA